MRFLGLDLSSRATGVCILAHESNQPTLVYEETIKLTKGTFVERLVTLIQTINNIIKNYHPTYAVLETPFLGCNVKSLSVLCQVRGAVLVALYERHLHVLDVEPNKVKQTVTGYGQATKNQVAQMMNVHLRCTQPFSSLDASDAAAVAYTGWLMTQTYGGVSV